MHVRLLPYPHAHLLILFCWSHACMSIERRWCWSAVPVRAGARVHAILSAVVGFLYFTSRSICGIDYISSAGLNCGVTFHTALWPMDLRDVSTKTTAGTVARFAPSLYSPLRVNLQNTQTRFCDGGIRCRYVWVQVWDLGMKVCKLDKNDKWPKERCEGTIPIQVQFSRFFFCVDHIQFHFFLKIYTSTNVRYVRVWFIP
jgi:hypothetical protein